MWTAAQIAERKARYEAIQAKLATGQRVDKEDRFWASIYEDMERVEALKIENARRDEETRKQFPYDPNANYPKPGETWDDFGLNVTGRKPEPQPELAPLTGEQKSALDFIASTGAGLNALAEIELSMRSSNSPKTSIRIWSSDLALMIASSDC